MSSSGVCLSSRGRKKNVDVKKKKGRRLGFALKVEEVWLIISHTFFEMMHILLESTSG